MLILKTQRINNTMTHRASLKEVMLKHDLLPKKSLGQNFLLDENITHKIAKLAGNLNGYRVIEVGPGPGGLTRAILDLGAAEVIAIELDPRCVNALADLNDDRLSIIQSDALKTNWRELLIASRPTKIIANLPYNVGTELVFQWLNHIDAIDSLTLMLQKEVVDRMVAKPSTKDYGRLSVMVQWLAHAKKVLDVPPHVFTPPPKVMSSVVHLTPNTHREQLNVKHMEHLVKQAFSQRRKMLKSTLKHLPAHVFTQANIDTQRRAETLSVDEFLNLARLSSTLL